MQNKKGKKVWNCRELELYGIRDKADKAKCFEIKLLDREYYVEFHFPALEKPVCAN